MKPISINSGYQPLVNTQQEKQLFFGGTSYLGLNYHPEILKIFTEGIQIWGLNNGASRNNNVQLSIYEEAEQALAIDNQTEASVTFSSGWLAAEVAVEVLSKNRDTIYVNDTHPALNAKNIIVLDLQNAVDYVNLSPLSDFLIVSNSLNNVIPKIFDFSALSQILSHKNVTLLLDHSHGFGILNNEWFAAIKNINTNIDVVLCGSLAKGISLDAGVVLGSQFWIAQIKKSATFNGASPCSPVVLYTYLKSKTIQLNALEKLKSNLKFLYSKLPVDDFFWTSTFPVIVINNPTIVESLINSKVLFTSFPYPYANSKSVNRLVISAAHSQSQIEKLLSIIQK